MSRRMIPLPPEDGKFYAMQNGEWVEIEAILVEDEEDDAE